MTQLISGLTTVTFDRNPTAQSGQSPSLRQIAGRDSAGALVCYRKATTGPVLWRLKFGGYNAISEDTLAALDAFRGIVAGMQGPFTWSDHLGTERIVHFAVAGWAPVPHGPRFEIELSLVEEI